MWGEIDVLSERSVLVTLPLTYTSFYKPQCTVLSSSQNPNGINLVCVYAFLHDLRTLKIQTDVLMTEDIDKPLKVSWLTIGK